MESLSGEDYHLPEAPFGRFGLFSPKGNAYHPLREYPAVAHRGLECCTENARSPPDHAKDSFTTLDHIPADESGVRSAAAGAGDNSTPDNTGNELGGLK